MQALQRGSAWAEERLWVLGGGGQSVPQNGRVHLPIIDSIVEDALDCNGSFYG